jgi:anti-sigma factor RsiW
VKGCEEYSQLLDQYATGDLPPVEHEAVEAHVLACPACRARVAEVRLAAKLLRQVATPRPPVNLVAGINSAAQTYLLYRRRPLHQKALGSPAFFATCASLMCGAVFCFLAIMKVYSVPPPELLPAPPTIVAGHIRPAPTRPVPPPRIAPGPAVLAWVAERLSPDGPPPSLVCAYKPTVRTRALPGRARELPRAQAAAHHRQNAPPTTD